MNKIMSLYKRTYPPEFPALLVIKSEDVDEDHVKTFNTSSLAGLDKPSTNPSYKERRQLAGRLI